MPGSSASSHVANELMPLTPGIRIGPYEIVARDGRGIVYDRLLRGDHHLMLIESFH